MIALYLAACTKESEHDAGRRLAVYAARDAFGIDCRLVHDSRGKPYFEAAPIHVSISHSDGMCLAAVSDRAIGADIERIRPRDADKTKRLASRFFAPEEAAAVHADPAEFYRIWTAKESFIKYTGEGFSRPLPSFSVLDSALTFTHIKYGDYAVAVCAEESAADAPLRIVLDFKISSEVKNMSTLHIIDHPLITHKLTIMRQKETGSKDFRELLNEIAMLMGYELTRDLPMEDVEIETPVAKMTAKMVSGKKLAIIPILRAGLGMVDGLLSLVPVAKVGHIGLYRDPDSHEPVEYYCKLPFDIEERICIVVDPMLATGGSSADALTMLKNKGCKQIKLMCLVAAPEGVKKVQEAHPDVDIYVAALDDHLNDHAYIVPGLGDAGDRLFGTK